VSQLPEPTAASPRPTPQIQSRSPERQIDPRGQRLGAGLSAGLLAAGFVANAPIFVGLIALALGTSSAFGTRFFILNRPWPIVRRVLRLNPPREPESEYPPRFAQALGTIGLVVAVVLFAVGATPWAWVPVAAVAALQTLLAATGYCLGCRLYFLRWYFPRLFDRLVGRSTVTRLDLAGTTRRFS
jgi:hypothetical protein